MSGSQEKKMWCLKKIPYLQLQSLLDDMMGSDDADFWKIRRGYLVCIKGENGEWTMPDLLGDHGILWEPVCSKDNNLVIIGLNGWREILEEVRTYIETNPDILFLD